MITFPTPYPKISTFFIVCDIWFCSLYCKYLRYTSHFMFSVEYLVLFIICICYLMEILCYLTFPWTNPWKYVSKKCDAKHVSLLCTDSWKSDIAEFLELSPGISMTHRHPANWKIGSPFVPPNETKFHSGPRTNWQPLVAPVAAGLALWQLSAFSVPVPVSSA